jgi:predicted RNA-binding protein YlxR (DUF448 family)
MRLFHQLAQEDQHNAIHYCMHLVVEDMLEDGVQLEPFSEEDKKAKAILERVIAEAKELPNEQQFEFVVHHPEGGQIIFDIALDMARGAYYHPDDDLVIHYESLRKAEHNQEQEAVEEILETADDLLNASKKNKHELN